MPVGTRLLFRSRKDWRFAVVSKITAESVTLSVASPSGYNYRVRKPLDMMIAFDGPFATVSNFPAETWKDNLTNYDTRW